MPRLAAIVPLLLMLSGGCQSPPAATVDQPALALSLQKQSDQIESLTATIATLHEQQQKLASQIALTHAPATKRDDSAPRFVPYAPRYLLASGPAKGLNNMDAIHILHAESGRVVVMYFNASNQKTELLAGRDLAKDMTPRTRRRDGELFSGTAVVPRIQATGSGFVTARAGAEEHALLVLDEAHDRLLIYTLDPLRKRMELVASEDLAKIFNVP